MKKVFLFFKNLFISIKENGLITHANELSYKLCLAFFPFIIFLLSLLSFLKISSNYFLEDIVTNLPESVSALISVFIEEITAKHTKSHAGLLSGSLILTIITASSGFDAVIKGISKAYGEKEERNFIIVRLTGIVLVLLLAFAIIASISILIFGGAIYNTIIEKYSVPKFIMFAFSASGTLILMVILLFTIIFIYKFATCKKVTVYETFPGAFITLIVWLLASKGFNIYISNFSRYSNVYGSIAGVIILMLWLNIISAALLIGGAINALLMPEKERKRGI